MPVSGLVVTFVESPSSAELALHWMNDDPRFMLGDPVGEHARRIPVTLETSDTEEDLRCWEEMQAHAGIAFVDVVCVFSHE